MGPSGTTEFGPKFALDFRDLRLIWALSQPITVLQLKKPQMGREISREALNRVKPMVAFIPKGGR
tara:strand:+ start:157 stop:351 length:195 start_codon:yes stop_codon:yes gene_type:complete